MSDIIRESRRQLNEYTPFGEAVSFASDVEATAASRFSDVDLRDRALDGARYVVAHISAEHLAAESIVAVNPTDPDTLAPLGDGTDANWPLLRLLGDRVYAVSTVATRRTFAAHLSGFSMKPNLVRPIYVFEDGEFFIASDNEYSSDGTLHTNASADFVSVPMFDASATYDGIVWANVTSIPIPSYLQGVLVNYVASSCFASLGLFELAVVFRKYVTERIEPLLLKKGRVDG